MSDRGQISIGGPYASLMREIRLDAATVFTDPRIQVWRSLPDRENAKLDHTRADGSSIRLHIKRYPAAFAAMAAREVQGYQLLAAAGVPSAAIIAHGSNQDGNTFIILEDLFGYTPADKLLELGFSFDRILTATADLAALLHSRKLHHRDLYLCHFMIRPRDTSVEAKLIDMARVSRLNHRLTRQRWIVKDLAQFWYSTLALSVSDPQRLQWLERYCEMQRISPASLMPSIRKKAAAIGRHDAILRKKQPHRNVSIDR